MASNYEKFSWSCSGFKTQEDAIDARDKIEAWFNKTHDANQWQVVSTVRQGSYGWKAELEAKYEAEQIG